MTINLKRVFHIVYLSMTLCMVKTNAQQLPLYSQYAMNSFMVNPAVVGSEAFTTYSLASRDHMLGFENSPKTFYLGIQGRLMRTTTAIRHRSVNKRNRYVKRSGRVGIGGHLFNDQNGYISRTGFQFSYAYHISTRETQYSLGVAFSAFSFQLNATGLGTRDPEVVYNDVFTDKIFVPDASIGGYVMNPEYFAGFSVANIFQTRIRIGSNAYDYRMFRHYFLMGGYKFLPDETFSYEPSLMLTATEMLTYQANAQFRCYYAKDYYLGVSYKTGSSVGLLLGARWNRLFFGYAFDYGLTAIQRYSIGSHEMTIALKLGDNTRRYRDVIRY